MADYGTAEYWEDRYRKDSNPYDWYQRWESMKGVIKDYLKLDDKILIIGNGTSRLPEEIYDEGYMGVEAMDISTVAVEIMHERLASRNIPCQVSDVLDMYQYSDNGYDVIVDKGTFDSILCGENSHINIDTMMRELVRVLSYNKGRYICISYGQPNYRLNYLKSMKEWEVTTIPIKKPANDQIYKLKNYNEDSGSQENASISTSTRPDLYHYIYVCTVINKEMPEVGGSLNFENQEVPAANAGDSEYLDNNGSEPNVEPPADLELDNEGGLHASNENIVTENSL
ncbi:methylase [Cryptosporidium canis]|uniref:Methylase n=1 Tax=Cryptosporidium canis TaxID=195482 RepID=A0A9D5DGJ2_9CRYT|nr:methylase [Cryptosporidium canis]